MWEPLPGSRASLLPKSGSCLPLGARDEDETPPLPLLGEASNVLNKGVSACKGWDATQTLRLWKMQLKSYILITFSGRN